MTGKLRRRDLLSASVASAACMAGGRILLGDEGPLVPTTNQVIRSQAKDAPLSMKFEGTTEDECRKWQAAFRARLQKSLGPHQPPPEWKVHVEGRAELKDHVREQLVLEAPDHPSLPIYVLSPLDKDKKRDAEKKKRAGVLAIHGHGDYGYDPVGGRDDKPGVPEAIERANYDYGRQLVKRGYVVVCPCMTPFGRRSEGKKSYGNQDPCAVTFVRMQLLGKVLMAENLRDCLWAFEFLARLKQVDPKRLACVGLSYGGRMTMLTSALEPRIRVAVPSGSLNVMQERVALKYSCGAQVIPGLLTYGDVPEISSLIAPRHCVWETGSDDGLIIPKWSDEALSRIRRAYRAHDAEDRLLVDRFEGGHQWSGRLAFPLLEKVLRSES